MVEITLLLEPVGQSGLGRSARMSICDNAAYLERMHESLVERPKEQTQTKDGTQDCDHLSLATGPWDMG